MFADPQLELRAEYKRVHGAHKRATDRLIAEGTSWNEAYQAVQPVDGARFRDLRCGARTKSAGTPCKLRMLYSCGRCKFHGGMSTGPRTGKGKKRSARNGLLATNHRERR